MTRSQQRLRWAVRTGGWSPDSAEWEMLLSLLPSAEERQQCMRYRNLDDRCRTLVGRLLARQAAAAALGLPFAAVDLRRTRGNKPYVANQLPSKAHGPAPNWNFSVSHEGDYVVLAAEPLCICGCDVAAPQQVRKRAAQPLHDWLRNFERQFVPAEWESIWGAGSEAEQEMQFRKLWSLKEAYVKATGEGLGFDLGKVEFRLSAAGHTAMVKVLGTPQPDWAFHLHELGGGHWVSVARAPLAAVVDAWGGFKATFQKTAFSAAEWQEQLLAPEPPFEMLTVADLVPAEHREAYEAAGGELY